MRILAIESSLMGGSVALLEGNEVRCEMQLDTRQRTAQTLLPAVQSILDKLSWMSKQIELVTTTIGPGSFTGLRIGVTAAKVFAYGAGAQVLGVSTMEVLVTQVPAQSGILWAVMEAEREQLFAAKYRSRGGTWHEDAAVGLVAKDKWLKSLCAGDMVTGPALRELQERLPKQALAVAETLWQPRAGVLGQVAHQLHLAGVRGDIWSLTPFYLRPSAAEEKRNVEGQSSVV